MIVDLNFNAKFTFFLCWLRQQIYQYLIIEQQIAYCNKMSWTRLFHAKSLPKAMQKFVPNKAGQQLHIPLRYQQTLKKQFRTVGVPWIYDLREAPVDLNEQKPKQSKVVLAKAMRIQKIQRALQQSQAKQAEFRQLKLNSRNNHVMDKLIEKTLPCWIKVDSEQKIPAYMKKKDGEF